MTGLVMLHLQDDFQWLYIIGAVNSHNMQFESARGVCSLELLFLVCGDPTILFLGERMHGICK